MCTTAIVRAGFSLFALFAVMMTTEAQGQLTNSSSQHPVGGAKMEELKVNVFFGTTKALGVDELTTNALLAVKRKGFVLPEVSKCTVNIQVKGKDVGCAVLFWDFKARVTYQVIFDSQGEVADVSGGPIGHAPSLPPGAPRPVMPEGGIRWTNAWTTGKGSPIGAGVNREKEHRSQFCSSSGSVLTNDSESQNR